MDFFEKLEKLARETCEREGCELYDLEFVAGSKGRGRILRVYVERADRQVALEDCEKVSRALSVMLDVEDPIPGGEYVLEVSTPGLERVLRTPRHFKAAVNKVIQLRTRESIMEFNPQYESTSKRMNAKGVIESVEDAGITIRVDNMELKVPFAIIDKAHVVHDYEANKGKKK